MACPSYCASSATVRRLLSNPACAPDLELATRPCAPLRPPASPGARALYAPSCARACVLPPAPASGPASASQRPRPRLRPDDRSRARACILRARARTCSAPAPRPRLRPDARACVLRACVLRASAGSSALAPAPAPAPHPRLRPDDRARACVLRAMPPRPSLLLPSCHQPSHPSSPPALQVRSLP